MRQCAALERIRAGTLRFRGAPLDAETLVHAFHNRTVVVTGASAGVGRAIALRFARAGARLGLIARDAAALAEVKAQAERLGGSALVAPADVSDPRAVFAAADEIARQLGPIEVWV